MPSVVVLVVRDTHALRAAYMPFIQYGGVFIRHQHQWRLGEMVRLLLYLPESEPGKGMYCLQTKVVWQTPKGAQHQRKAGVGLQFPEDHQANEVRLHIERLLDQQSSPLPVGYTFALVQL